MSFATRLVEAEIARNEYRRALTIIADRSPPAGKRGASECCRSGVCCWRAPGELDKADVSRLAARFGLSESEFFRAYCVVDTHSAGDGYILRLRRRHQIGGEMLHWRESYRVESPCVMLDTETGNACGVHADKPGVCERYKCWEGDDKTPMPAWTGDELRAIGWDGVDPDDAESDYEN